MLKHNELTKGILFIYNGQPHQVLEHLLVMKGRGNSKMQVKIKNLKTGAALAQTFHTGQEFEEAELEKIALIFIYKQPDKFVFHEQNDKSKRIELSKEQIGPAGQFLKQNQAVVGLVFDEQIIGVEIPVKVVLKVVEAPPAVRGNRAEAGTKPITLETGAIVNAPLFIKEGDLIEINTTTNQYVRRT